MSTNTAAEEPTQTTQAEAPAAPAEAPAAPSFNLDAWKRYYSNAKDLRGDAMNYFWDHYDENECSLWLMKYQRYNDQDNVEGFKASNLLGMFYQRIDNSVRRSAFAVCDIVKRDGYHDIQGVMFCVGKELPEALKEHDQFPSFTWERLEIPKDKKIVEDYFCEDDFIDGGAITDCKVYK